MRIKDIENEIYKKFDKNENKWIFISWFNKNWLVISLWSILVSKPLQKLIPIFYNLAIDKKVDILVIDIVKNIEQLYTNEEILNTNVKDYWFCIVSNDEVWVILPNMKWVVDSKIAIWAIKQKINIWSDLKVYRFTTERFTFIK